MTTTETGLARIRELRDVLEEDVVRRRAAVRYGIDKVRRAGSIRIDRHHLAGLNELYRLKCV